ncbi:MAG: ABC-type Mn2+/Zn2+ transport system ATPase subunit [Thermoproteota archaeon]|jgi:ABC-type Mn2+/Zn2+ transport system ATPase subunit
MIEIKNLDIFIAKKIFFKDINITITSGDILRVDAPNGGGKSTFIETLLKLRNEYSGYIKCDFSSEDYGYLPQVAHQFPKIYLQFKDICPKSYSFYPKELLNKNWHTSSGGERKKALIAKAIYESKKLLILDEPFNHLDKESCQLVAREIEELAKSNVAVIYTGHEYIIPGSKNCEVSKWRS